MSVEVFGVSHDRRSGVWAAGVIRRGKPDIVCFEAWAEFVKLFNYFDSGRIDMLSDDSDWKEVLPLLKWYWNFAMSFLEKEPMMKAAKEVGAEAFAIDVSTEERMRQESQYIREVRKKASSFKMRVWFTYKIFPSLDNLASRPFGRFPSLMNSMAGKVYFQTSRRLWDWMSPESKWWGDGREKYMTQRIAEILNKHEGCKIFVFVGTKHKWNLQHLVDTRLLAKRQETC